MISLRDAQAVPESMIGGKARALACMMAEGFPVKPGLVVPVAMVSNILRDGCVPAQCGQIVYAGLDVSSGLAVRSSAVGEDGADTSWAGQFKTMLGVTIEGLDEAILACARSRDGDLAQSYSTTLGNGTDIALALIVQEMVPASCAGVLFTKDPKNRQVGKMVIEVVPGLGDLLVSGQRSPHRYILDAQTGEIVSEEGPCDVSLTSERCGELVEIGRRLRALFGAEQDIEWVIDFSGRLFLTQSRTITVQYASDTRPLIERETNDLADGLAVEQGRLASLGFEIDRDVLSDQNIAELITPHPCQMAFGLFTYLFACGQGAIRRGRNAMGYDLGPELEEGFFRLVAGQPRVSIVHDALTYRIRGIPLADYRRIVEYYLDRILADPSLGNYPEVVLYNQNPSLSFLTELFGASKATEFRQAYEEFFVGIRRLEGTLDEETRSTFIPWWRRAMSDLERFLHPGADVTELVGLYTQVAGLLRLEACRMFVFSARLGFFAFARLRNRLAELFPGQAEQHINVLTSGIPVERNPNLAFSIRLAELRDGRVTVEQVMDEFGHLAMHELEISVPRYRDQPDRLRRMAANLEKDPLADFDQSRRAAIALREEVMCGLDPASVEDLAREIDVVRTFLSLRELVKFEYLRGFDLLRRVSVALSRTLGWDDDLIFHLDPREVFMLDPGSMGDTARQRRALHRERSSIYVPPVVFSGDLGAIGVLPKPNGNILRGIGVTNAIAEGTVVVVHDPTDDDAFRRLRPGSILVTVTTDPAWSPLLSVVGRSGGLVTEVGGLLAHGAIYAREVGFAAVLNVPGASSILRTGMRVRVVGPEGYVEILEK